MIVPVMAISNLVLTQQIYSEETNGAHAHYREPVPLRSLVKQLSHRCHVMLISNAFSPGVFHGFSIMAGADPHRFPPFYGKRSGISLSIYF